jgi:hypothetical protein
MEYAHNKYLGRKLLPVDIVLAPEWWNHHEGISFDRDFFFHPVRRVEEEQRMEKVLHDRWGRYGLGQNKDEKRPELGAVHLAAGFLLSEMLGCKVEYSEAHPPRVITRYTEEFEIDVQKVFRTDCFREQEEMWDRLKSSFGYITGDINWGGVLNLAMDLRGEQIFMDMMQDPEGVDRMFSGIATVIERFLDRISSETGTTSISVNRTVAHLEKPVVLHSQCSHTMISAGDYERFLMPFDLQWSRQRPYGIHYCGKDPHRMAVSFAKIPNLDFLDVGWGGDIKILRNYLPGTFLNIRLSPVELINKSCDEIREDIVGLVKESGNPNLTGVCCINMDDKVSDEKIDTIFETVNELRESFSRDMND